MSIKTKDKIYRYIMSFFQDTRPFQCSTVQKGVCGEVRESGEQKKKVHSNVGFWSLYLVYHRPKKHLQRPGYNLYYYGVVQLSARILITAML
jgi:hypothetical protein